MSLPEVIPYEGLALIEISRREITPPIGIYGRMWGASNHDQSEGTHKSLYVTAIRMLACSHTHASPWFARSRSHLPSGNPPLAKVSGRRRWTEVLSTYEGLWLERETHHYFVSR